MKAIRCIYKDGTEKVFEDKVIIDLALHNVKAWNEKKGLTYLKLLDSPMVKMYIDDELVIDKGEI